jgi:hypothetical protein
MQRLRTRLRHLYRWARLRLPQPWSRRLGQLAYLPRLATGHRDTRRAFAEERVIEPLVRGRLPLESVGVGLSERVVEIPWVLRRLADLPAARILDIGTAFSPAVYQHLLVRLPQEVETADLARTDIPGLHSHVADVRRMPFAADAFDVAIAISTLEHVGMDNDIYGVASGGGDDVTALRELGRVAPTVLVTVPAGADANMGWQRQYQPSTFRRVVEQAGLTVAHLDVFVHDPARGWTAADDEHSVADRQYGRGAVAAAAVICAQLTRA